MKRIILILLLTIITALVFATTEASGVTLEWDANDPVPDGYRLFVRQAENAYDYSTPVWTGTATRATIDDLESGQTYFFVVRAYAGDEQSGDSNEIEYTVPALDSVTAPSGLTDAQKTQLDQIEIKIDRILSAVSVSDTSTAAYCGNPDTKIFHKSSHWCGQGAVGFTDRQAAVDAGYRACGVCDP